MTENAGLIKSVVESDPWQKYGFTGQVFSVVGVLSYLGIGFAGLEIGHTSAHAPLLIIVIGGVYLFVSYKLKKNKDIAKDERRKFERPKSEPTEGDQIFLDQFRAAGGKMSIKELQEFVTPHDKGKTPKEKNATIAMQRAEGWIVRGKMVRYANSVYTREAFEDTQKDMTVIQ